jgi:hypothetical protein
MTRATIVWFVGAAVVGAAAGVLHFLRSDLGGAHHGQALAVAAWGVTALAALMIFHGIVLAGREQDDAAGPQPVDTPDAYVFRHGREVGTRPRGRQRR